MGADSFGAPVLVWGNGCGLSSLTADVDVDTFDLSSHSIIAAAWRAALQGSAGKPGVVARAGAAPVFVCPSRFAMLERLAYRLVRLDDGLLTGQRNCFAVFGTRGIGKTHFLKSIGAVVAACGRPTTGFVYVNCLDHGVREPRDMLRELLLQRDDCVSEPDLADPHMALSDVLAFMARRGLRAVLVIDEVEMLYKREREDATFVRAVHAQLHTLGELSGARPVLAVGTGNVAVLRSLLFALPDDDGAIRADFPFHRVLGSLNDRKYAALELSPIVARGALQTAVLCLTSGSPLQSAVRQGRLVPAGRLEGVGVGAGSGTDGGAGLDSDAVSGGYTVADSWLDWVAGHCRGLSSWIGDAVDGDLTTASYWIQMFGGDRRRNGLRILFTAWEKTVGANVVDAAVAAQSGSSSFSMPIRDQDFTSWLRLMDAGVVTVEDASVRFMHPTDIAACVMHFRDNYEGATGPAQPRDPMAMTAAEMLSLVWPSAASADELNERLVIESLAWKSEQDCGLQLHDRTLRNLCIMADHIPVCDDDRRHTAKFLPLHTVSFLGKEFPDMGGADIIGWVNRAVDGSVGANSRATLLRCQVKMSEAAGATTVSGPTVNAWLDTMQRASVELVESIPSIRPDLGGSGDAGVDARHVFWIAQSLTGPARLTLQDRARVSLLVDSHNMLDFWCPRVRKFVIERGMTQYGARNAVPAATAATAARGFPVPTGIHQ